MIPRDRVLMSLQHEQPDRCPMQISFTPESKQHLLSYLKNPVDLKADPYALDRYIKSDMLLASVGWMNSYNQTKDKTVDEWGVGWKAVEYDTPYGKGRYTEVEKNPLAVDDAVDFYKAPDPHREELYAPAVELIRSHKKDYWIVGVTKTTIFECAWGLRGLEQLMVDFMLDPDLAAKILNIPYQYHLEAAKRLVREGVDMVWIGDDVGSQKGMLISPDHWRQFLKPLMASFISELRTINKDIYIAYHTDGAVDPIIPELIEIGVDILNPIQPNCMNPAELKSLYGDKLSFWGAIDQQNLLPFESSDRVYKETKQMIEILGRGGGYIAGPTHNIQLDVPMDNLWSMVKAITE